MSNTMRHSWVILAVGLLVGCASEPVRLAGPEVLPLAPAPRTAYSIHLAYTSEIPDPYYVLSGPIESYGRYAITSQFRALLEDQVAQLSDPASQRSATLTVHLSDLDTRYRRVGSSSPPTAPQGPLYAMLGTEFRVVPATWPATSARHLLGMNRDDDIPAEIHKGATLVVTVKLDGDGLTPLSQTVTAQHDDMVTRWDFDPRHTYSYSDVLDETLRVAATQITEIVVTHLK